MTGSACSVRLPGLAALVLAFLLAPGLARGAVAVRAEVSPRSIAEDRNLELRLVVEGEGIGELAPPPLPDLDDWKVVGGPSVASQFRFVNGVASSSRTFSWMLAPVGPGTRRIPALALDVGGRVYRTEPLTVEVRPGAGQARDAAAGPVDGAGAEEDVFVRAQLEPERPYVGQRAILRYRLYTRVEVSNIPQLQEVPSYPNFWSEELETPDRISPSREMVDGAEYQVYTIKTVALFPTASGPTRLPPVIFSIPVRSRDPSGVRRSFFFSSIRPVSRRTLALEVDVRPLPSAGRPADFSNAVGRFELRVEPDRRQARAGEAIGVTVTVRGEGNLRSAVPPVPAPAADFTIYPPQDRAPTPGSGVARAWEYIMVPHLPGRQPLPELSFSYFDPEAGAYRTLTAPDLPVEISGPPLAQGEDGTLQRQEIRRLGRDIHFIKELSGSLERVPTPLYRSGWFWAGLVLPPLANAGALAVRWGRQRARRRRPLNRRRRARRTALRRLRRAATEEDSGAFHREVARALSEFVADKFGSQATGLTYDRIAALLAARSVSDEASRRFLEVLEECDVARFSPAGTPAAGRDDLLARARQSLDDLESGL